MKYINVPESGKLKRIVVVGGGFAGLNFVRKLAKSNLYQIILLDKYNFHQFQPLYYQVGMSGLEPSSICFPIRKIFRRNDHVFFRVAEVKSVNPEIAHHSNGYGRVGI